MHTGMLCEEITNTSVVAAKTQDGGKGWTKVIYLFHNPWLSFLSAYTYLI